MPTAAAARSQASSNHSSRFDSSLVVPPKDSCIDHWTGSAKPWLPNGLHRERWRAARDARRPTSTKYSAVA